MLYSGQRRSRGFVLIEKEKPMNKIRIFVATLMLTLVALAGAPATKSRVRSNFQTPPAGARQWQVNNSSTVLGSTAYELHNLRRRKLNLTSQLGYAKRDVSLWPDPDSVDWVGTSGGHFEFRRPNIRDHRTVSPSESLALYNTKIRKYFVGRWVEDKYSGYLWSSSPAYEWQVHDRQGADFALYNTRILGYYIFDEKHNFKPGLRWLGKR